jgi:hypothetical protein
MSEKIKPKIIAWSNGFTVIPFENVLSVQEDTIEGQLVVYIDSKRIAADAMIIGKKHAQEFIDQYNTYLATVESLTVSIQLDDLPDGKVVIK